MLNLLEYNRADGKNKSIYNLSSQTIIKLFVYNLSIMRKKRLWQKYGFEFSNLRIEGFYRLSIYIWKDREANTGRQKKEREAKMNRQADRQIKSERKRETQRGRDRQWDRKRDRDKYRDIYINFLLPRL